MVLCQWAVTPHREGLHRPLVVAHILERRQQELLKVLIDLVWVYSGCVVRVVVLLMVVMMMSVAALRLMRQYRMVMIILSMTSW